MQIDIYSRTVSEAASIETAIETLMSASAIVNVPLSSQDLYEDQVKAILGIPEKVRVIQLLALGYPKDKPGAKSRVSVSEIVCYDRWTL